MRSTHHTTFRYQLFALCVAFAHVVHAAPIPQPQPAFPTPLTVSTGLPTPSEASTTATATPVGAQQLWPSPLVLTDPSPSSSGSPSTSQTSTSSSSPEVLTDTQLVTVTATQTAAPVTVTQTILFTSIVTDTPSTSAVFSSLPPSSSVSPTETLATASPSITSKPSAKASWSVPADFDGNVTRALGTQRWSWGAKNAQLVDSIPASAWATPTPSASTSTSANQAAVAPAVDLSNGPAMQVTFPKGSINPANKKAPTGGVGLYISPLDLSKAKNVSLEYSVFFPADFDFVKGGKLPGMYGGHKGCSGGQDSEDCFSTRLMFRSGGKGELYLYAPKSDPKLSESLCATAPLSYCDSTYGWSIGRGAWTFERGAWSNIRQEIRLNTPGVADGGVRIFVNDKLVLSSDAVLYRADLAPASSTTDSSPFSALPTAPPQPTETTSTAPEPTSTATTEDQGLLGGLLGGLADDLGQIIKRSDGTGPDVFYTTPAVTKTVVAQPTETVFATSTILSTPSSASSATVPVLPAPARAGLLDQLPGLGDTTDVVSSVADAVPLVGNGSILAPKKQSSSGNDENATFQGIMFNTFFGGNDPSWASPEEQNIWFNRISLSILA